MPLTFHELTKRQGEVAALLIEGKLSNKEMGEALGVTERTVKWHVAAVFKKYNVRSRVELSRVVNDHQHNFFGQLLSILNEEESIRLQRRASNYRFLGLAERLAQELGRREGW